MAGDAGQEIVTQTAGRGENEAFYETSAYLESPIGEHAAFVAAPWFREGANSGEDDWLGEAVIGFKAELDHSDHGAMALEAGALWRSHPKPGCGEGGAEVRWLGGRSFGKDDRGFANLEAAGDVQAGGCTGGRVDVTVGYRPNHHWLALANVFVDDARYGQTVVHAQLSLVRFEKGRTGIEVGVRARLDGDEREPALVLSVWREPKRRRG
jgi:hypothetical protein